MIPLSLISLPSFSGDKSYYPSPLLLAVLPPPPPRTFIRESILIVIEDLRY